MKKTIKTVLVLAACVVLAGPAEAKKKTDKKTENVVYLVNIHCNDCKEKIENKIPFEKGVKDLEVDMEKNQVTITFDPQKTDKEKVKKALQNLEFQVKEVPAKQ